VALLGVPVVVALAFELWLNANALFNHSNVKLPARADKLLRRVLVTPDMHLVHHSIIPSDQHRNYGFALTIWDRIFGTYAAEQSVQPLGLASAQDTRPGQMGWSMLLPFRKFN
jgi:sterol desaturase/sphingolipid hydroxylase (fatty acid hydroxylase superfamily)